ncbi:MAG: FHA domain-containing protein [Candidatus Nealsonbacteria bacterium]|nr:FHA domain-containing protein [Candidatus Nealsonbacteria bacterium]
MDAKLIVVGGKADRRAVKLKLPTVIGRSREADLTVPHPMISRQHCKLYEVDGLLMVRDLDSLNGVFLADQRVSESPLRPDDEFTVGPLTFRAAYTYQGDPATVPAPKIVEPEEPEPEEPQLFSAGVDDETPFDPTFAAAGGMEPPPDFLSLQQRNTDSPAEEVLDFSTWGDTPAKQSSAEEIEEVDIEEVSEIEIVEDEEEEEPEPTPPPPFNDTQLPDPQLPDPQLTDTQPTAKEAPDAETPDAAAWEAVQVAAAEDLVRGGKPKPPSKKRRWALGGSKQKDQPEPQQPQAAASTPAPKPPTPPSPPAKKQQTTAPKSEDDELNEFFKGLS